MPAARPTRAASLLRTLLGEGVFTAEELASELVVSPKMLSRFVAGTEPIPYDRQLYLATLIVQRVPKYAREGHRLAGHARAAIAYEAGVTARHTDPPPETFRTS